MTDSGERHRSPESGRIGVQSQAEQRPMFAAPPVIPNAMHLGLQSMDIRAIQHNLGLLADAVRESHRQYEELAGSVAEVRQAVAQLVLGSHIQKEPQDGKSEPA